MLKRLQRTSDKEGGAKERESRAYPLRPPGLRTSTDGGQEETTNSRQVKSEPLVWVTQGSSSKGDLGYPTSNATTPTNERRTTPMSEMFTTRQPDEIPDGVAKNELLLRAITKGQLARVVHLLTSGADIDCQDQYGQGVLHYAIAGGHDHVFDVLVHRGADVDLDSPLQGTPICAAAQLQRWSLVERLIELRVDVNAVSSCRGTPLHWACIWGETKSVALLLKNGATCGIVVDISLLNAPVINPDAPREHHFHTRPLHPDETPQVHGVPVSVVCTPLSLAAQFRHLGCVQALLISNTQRSEALSVQQEGQLALRYAICTGSKDIVRLLLQSCISPDSDEDPEGNRALLVAVEHERWDSVEQLLKHNARTDVIQRDGKSMVRIFLSAQSYDREQSLLARWQSVALSGTWMESVMGIKKDKVVMILLQVKTDFASALRRQDIDTLELHFVYRVARVDNYTIFKTMQSLGGNINVTDHLGNTALSLATSVGDIDAMKRLLDALARTDLTSGVTRDTPLMIAVERRHMEAMQLLLSKSADPNIRNAHGWTPLHFAAKHGDIEIIELLVKAGADINIKDADSQRAVEVALSSKQIKAMEALIRLGATPVDPMTLI
ncbi:hypothetical protein B0A48_18433 [Cryoendolithus antarcticus]|uniref:Uncharacterized protein n=1 Tax=Cryoendolithus antarcticus TaxID=1507870 RepID=A0A1V8S869_9PEZI|nr:hypothetical protein B0A48_18433 [Cryoendolithus antarcticus]